MKIIPTNCKFPSEKNPQKNYTHTPHLLSCPCYCPEALMTSLMHVMMRQYKKEKYGIQMTELTRTNLLHYAMAKQCKYS